MPKKQYIYKIIVKMKNQPIYDIIIIGSGISGLYCAYQLQNRTRNICILEKEACIGGRIRTIQKPDGSRFEVGAEFFHNKHHRLGRLLIDLGLARYKKRIHINTCFSRSQNDNETIDHYDTLNHVNPFELIEPVYNAAEITSKYSLQQFTFIEFVNFVISDSETVYTVLDSLSEHELVINMNAYDAIQYFKNFRSNNTFYTLTTGMSSIIEALYHSIGDIPIHTEHEVENIEYYSGTKESHGSTSLILIYVKNRKEPFLARNCVCALPKIALEKLSIFDNIQSWMNNIGVRSISSIYAMYRKSDVWFKHFPRINTDNGLGSIVPIDCTKGLIMLSRTDDIFNKYWKSLLSSNNNKIFIYIQEYFHNIFKFYIPVPKWIDYYHWDTGMGYWKPGCNSEQISKYMLTPHGHDVPLYICGENFSEKQGWIEGALETSHKIVKFLEMKFPKQKSQLSVNVHL